MPCSDGLRNQKLEETRVRLDRVTNLLCYVMRTLSAYDINTVNAVLSHDESDGEDLHNWWSEHCLHDARREAGM